MNISFDEKYCKNIDKSLKTEWLEINNLGSYSSSTIYGLNNKKEHGLFVVPSFDPKYKVNLLSKLEETVFVKDFSFELSANQYENSIYPDGFKYLIGFDINPFPVFHYKISDRRLDKSLLLLHDKNVLIVRYELKNNGDPIKLIIKPIIAGRQSHNLIKDVQGINPDSYMAENVVKIAPRSDLPEINLSYNKGDYTPAALWYHNFFYKSNNNVESGEGKEDLLNPGFFTYTLEPYDSFEIYISTDEWFDFDYEYLHRREKEQRQNVNKKFIKLPTFIQDISKKIETIPLFYDTKNYTCFPDYFQPSCNVRNTIIAMNDALVVEEGETKIKNYIEKLIKKLNNGLIVEEEKENYQSVYADASLQLINLCYYFYRFFKNDKFLEEIIYEPLHEVIESFRKGTEFNIYMDKDGLIFSGDKYTSTGMLPLINEKKQVIRYGKLLEINIFWLNALYIMRFFSKELNKQRLEKKYTKLIETVSKSFVEKFWNEDNDRLYDFIREDIQNKTFRFNQIYAISIPFQILEKGQGKRLLYSIKNELATSYGLRSLSKEDDKYVGKLSSSQMESDVFKYMGPIIPSTIGDYIIGCINYGEIKNKSIELAKLIENFEQLITKNCLGYFPEFLEGDEPHNEIGNPASISNMLSFLKAAFYFHKSTSNKKS